MPEFLQRLLSTEGYHPHGFCYLWQPELVWLHVVSDSLIGLAYLAIGATLAMFVTRGSGDIPFSRIFVAFGVFIAACGATHFMQIWTLWSPVYWLSGSVKVVTAAASVVTAVVLPPLVPLALGTIRSARVSERRREELEDANAELASLYERLKEADEAKTRFFANVSHELRTPLALILGPTARLLSDPELGAERRESVQLVQRNAELLLRHVSDLLDVQKLEAGRMPVQYARLDLADAVRLWTEHFDSASLDHELELTVRTPASLPAEADPEMIGRVVLNLVGNAVKFTPSGGRVRCELRAEAADADSEPDRAVLEVHDSGPGIPPEHRERVFEAFRQVDDSATRGHGGTGLGLAIVRDLVELHGGTVRIEDSPLGGALLRVELPLRAPEGTAVAAEPQPVPGVAASVPAPTEAGHPEDSAGADEETATDAPLVLVVEDNDDMRRFVRESLRGVYRVETASNGREGLELARRLVPDLILSDLMMPELSGDQMLEEVRRTPELDASPVLLLTARADDALRTKLLTRGAQDYLTKPFAVEELRARVGNWISTKRAGDLLRRELNTTRSNLEELAGELVQQGRERESALATTRLALEEAREANRVKADFLSVMSHELRTPLNAIIGFADLLQLDSPLSSQQQTRLDRIQWNSAHLLRLVEEVLTYARAEAGRERVHVDSFDLRELARHSMEQFAGDASSKGIALELAMPEAPVPMRTDSQKLQQAMQNLIGNAVKFTDEGRVSILLEQRGDHAALQVRDTGPGIDPAHAERVFEPFWQVDSGKTRRSGGAGLGLAIVRQLVGLLGGEVRLQSEPGRGSLFTLVVPCDHASAAGAEPPSSA